MRFTLLAFISIIAASLGAAHNFSVPSDRQSFLDFINSLPADTTSRNAGIFNMLDSAATDSLTYTEIYALASETLYADDAPLRDEELYIPFLRHALNGSPLAEADKSRASYRLMMALKNRVGTPANDFHFIDRGGESRSLHSIKSDKDIFLIFYDPDCDYCHNAMEKLIADKASDRMTIVAIYAGEDRSLWDSTKDSLPSEWIVGFATDPIDEEEVYFIPSMPTTLLLDNNFTVLKK